MRRILLSILTAAICFAQRPSAPTEESRLLFAQMDGILAGLSEITGWKVKKKVPADFITREQLHSFVERRLKEVVKPEEIRLESLSLKMFGLVPEDYDLEKATVDLVTEQAAAFYDYNRKRLFITESTGTFLEQRIVLVHELAHALADQQFPLARYIRKGGRSDDESTAREAVMEGQATWLMWAYSSKLAGGEAQPSEIILDTMRTSGGSGGSQYPVFDSAPLYLRESMLFPYNQGVLFQDAVVKKMGRNGFTEVFRRAPRTSAEILHPEEYFARKTPPRLETPPIPDSKRFKTTIEGSMGEFDHRILAEQYTSREEAARIAPKWRAGEFRIGEEGKGGRAVLTYASEWDTADAAKEWFAIYRRVLKGKSKELDFSTDSAAEMAGRNERGGFRVKLEGTRVLSVEGLP